MARRHLTFTLTFTLDEDAVRDADIPYLPNGDTTYDDTLNLLRTALHHQAALILAPFDAHLDNPQVEYIGLDYEPGNSAYEPL